MKKKIVLPSLFVLNAFLVGFTPKTNKAGSVATYNPTKDSVVYTLNVDSNYWLSQKTEPLFTDLLKTKSDSVKTNNQDSVSYDISWNGGNWVKYTSNDGSGFIRTGGSRTWRNMNPGAIRPGEIPRKYGSCGSAGGFAVFPTEEHGMKALIGLLKSDKYSNLTIAAAIYKWAPPSDHNNTRLYQRRLSQMTGLSLTKKICQLTAEEMNRVANAIKVLEGWKPGQKELFVAQNDTTKITPLLANAVRQNQYGA